jgi:hypothetical protein
MRLNILVLQIALQLFHGWDISDVVAMTEYDGKTVKFSSIPALSISKFPPSSIYHPQIRIRISLGMASSYRSFLSRE